MGIDIGAATSKGVLVENGKVVAHHLVPSRSDYRVAAEKVRLRLLATVGLSQEDIRCTVATGRGAATVAFTDRRIPDIVCCGRGIKTIFPSVCTVIDVGDQSSQVIRIDREGKVVNFVHAEKCAAGSGRFLQVIANVLRINLDDIGPLSLKSNNPVTFTTGCAVFGETEVVSRVAEGDTVEDILAGVHKALAQKVCTLVERLGKEGDYAIVGGGGLDVGLVKAIEKELAVRILVPSQPQIVAALGAAIIAAEEC
jgi:predicted CoA-substrate-specific enzyme activase